MIVRIIISDLDSSSLDFEVFAGIRCGSMSPDRQFAVQRNTSGLRNDTVVGNTAARHIIAALDRQL